MSLVVIFVRSKIDERKILAAPPTSRPLMNVDDFIVGRLHVGGEERGSRHLHPTRIILSNLAQALITQAEPQGAQGGGL